MVIYALRRYAVDHHGVVTRAAAAGVSAAELAGLVQQGVLEHVAGDVYRLVDVGPTSLTEYAEAVALAGHGAVLAEDAVLALHDLTALARPQRLRVVVPGRPSPPAPAPWVQVLFRDLPDEDVTDIEGISAMTVLAALRACRGQVMSERLLQAVDRAREEELITSATAQELRGELAPSPLPPTPWT
ncbi:hypothetical protein JOD57_000876 [Geodermatophilus bullaregiensis]|uniref:hypothetical protein n=1 Tax=Geodermatophilus bullaregiensis TaxID=1564160 RepID=UPI0019584535|nr:hypothetical protein [Geodermatophilus bullaregiensis]MBM7805039.1 hypothetical protein [Geodermatophilus bullaregiensis]